LENEADMVAAKARQVGLASGFQYLPVYMDLTGAGAVNPTKKMQQCSFTPTTWSYNNDEGPSGNIKIYAAQCFNLHFTMAIMF
jgi:LDH2 family malate/lactate/ureidoglycolate dehydrogenase